MRRVRSVGLSAACALVTMVVAGCAQAAGGRSDVTDGSQTSVSEDLLARIVADGQLRVAIRTDHPPRSSFDATTQTWEGFDVDVATEIANRMGVQVAWQTPAWDTVTAGDWHDGWDISVGSMMITDERSRVLDLTDPYYFASAGLAVEEGSEITSVDELAGATIGVCRDCTYRSYLDRSLDIPGYDIGFLVPADVHIVTYDSDAVALQDLAGGRLDAVMSAMPTLQGAIDAGEPVELLGDPVFYEPFAVAVDKSAPLPDASLVEELNRIITDMHEDDTLRELSLKWFKEDLTTNPLPSAG